MSLKIKKGDLVMMISGDVNRGQGRTGRVLSIDAKHGAAIVEGLNVYRKHQKARSQQDPGGIIDKAMPIPLCKLMLCTGGGQPQAARFGTKIDDKGNKVRVLKLGGPKEVRV